MKSEKPKILDKCYDRVYSGDMTVFKECFTTDYTLTIPETQLMTEAGYLKGKLAVEFLSYMIRNDDLNFDRMIETFKEVDRGDLVVREKLYTMRKTPDKTTDMKGNDCPPDMKLSTRLITLYGFRNGKICEEFTTCNLLGTEVDFAQGDKRKSVARILKMEPMMKEMKTGLAKGELSVLSNPT